MTVFARSDTSVLGRWWWTVDRWTLAALAALLGFGVIMVLAASPAVAQRIGLDYFYFARREMLYLPLTVGLMLAASLLSPRGVLRVSILMLIVFTILVMLTFVMGMEIKGARRWISLGFLSLQPSEFVKPAFAVVAAWLFSAGRTGEIPRGNLICIVLFGFLLTLLLLQPDVGMSVVVAAVWCCQFFLAGLPLVLAGLLVVGGITGMTGAYFAFDHVASRVDRFLNPAAAGNYQVNRSLEAFSNGGLLGRGPGEGTVKEVLPDAHSDFVFAVAGEEFGVIVCLIIIALFAFVVLRAFTKAIQETNLFVLLATTGLVVDFGLQAIINMGSTLRLLPTKGMTLPFISYGGSSMIAMGICMGFLLALTRKRVGAEAML